MCKQHLAWRCGSPGRNITVITRLRTLRSYISCSLQLECSLLKRWKVVSVLQLQICHLCSYANHEWFLPYILWPKLKIYAILRPKHFYLFIYFFCDIFRPKYIYLVIKAYNLRFAVCIWISYNTSIHLDLLFERWCICSEYSQTLLTQNENEIPHEWYDPFSAVCSHAYNHTTCALCSYCEDNPVYCCAVISGVYSSLLLMHGLIFSMSTESCKRCIWETMECVNS